MTRGGRAIAERAEIERIVREVLAEMATSARATSQDAGSELVVSDKVVSTGSLEERLDGIARVVVPRGAVITPAARDLLRERQIAIATAVTDSKNIKEQSHVVVGTAETEFTATSVISVLRDADMTVERLPQTGLLSVVDELCDQVVKGGRFGLMITPRTAAALCLANRQHGVRAALGTNPAAAADAVNTIAANVLVVDPRGKALFEWNQIVRAWLRPRHSGCSEQLRKRLG